MRLSISRPTLAAVFTAVLLAACQARVVDTPPAGSIVPVQAPHPAWSRSATIYEVNVRQFTPQGTFAAFQEHLARLRQLGVDILWIMPVQPIGVLNRKGSLGSYYSIRDYTAVNPEHGTEADFRRMVDAAHALGMKVILDWVPNHTAFDHEWTRTNRDYYTLRPDGSISVAIGADGKETDWTDVADLNYSNQNMRQAMIREMLWWVREMRLDGFRVDVAWGVPYDFWPQMRSALLAEKPDLFLLAEAEDPRLHEWYDMTYGWEFHHLLNEVAKGVKGTDAISAYFTKQRTTYPADAYRMYFTSNHDENSWQGTEFERMGANNTPAFVVSATVQNGMPLIYTGQEVSLNKRLRFFEKDTVDWNGPSRVDFYRRMMELRHSQAALRNGAAGGPQVELTHNSGNRVYAFSRTRDASTVVVVANFAPTATSVGYSGFGMPGSYIDWFSGERVELGRAGTIAVDANGFRLLVAGR